MITNKDISIDSKKGKITLNGNKYDLGTQGEIDTAVKGVYSVMGQMGAKNLLVPEWAETQTTENGVTYTFNADGTIIMNTDASGATANTNCNLRKITATTNNVFPAGTYTLTACPAGGSSTTYRTWARAYRPDTNTALTDNLYEEGNGVSFTVSEPFSLGINATVMSGYVCNNLTWKPMLRYASDTDNTYEPYAMTNKQLTDRLATKRSLSVSSNVIGDAVGIASATSENPYLTSHEGFVRFVGPSCLCINTYRMMKSADNIDYKGMWLPKGVSIYFEDGTPPLAQWFNCSNE